MDRPENRAPKKLLKLSWIPYILILFEMLYMATPFAVFFYSIYELPLKFLNSSPKTAWMLQTVFPHFVETNSVFINFLLIAGWLFMLLGLVVFIVAFIQIYYAKFTKKGAVTGGLYSIIRHPQYAAWTLFGLGMSIIWSRIIVWMMFVTMTFIYYILARAEEKECSQKFPESYLPYLQKTGMFFPRFFNVSSDRKKISNIHINSVPLMVVSYIITMSATIFSAYVLRNHTISKMSTVHGKNYVAVSVTQMTPESVKKTVDIVFKNPDVKKEMTELFSEDEKMILYLLPQNWIVSELGMDNVTDVHSPDRGKPQIRPSSHGNPKDNTPMKKRVIVSLAKLTMGSNSRGILHNLKQQIPKLYVDIDLKTKKVTNIIANLSEGIYRDIPVPVY